MDTVKTTWKYPPNWDGYFPGDRGFRRMIVQLSNLSDGTGETDVIKVAREDLKDTNGDECLKICVEKIEYATHGMGVEIQYDMNPVQTIAIFPQSDSGCLVGPWYPDLGEDTAYADGETGNIIFSTVAAAANDSYDITLHLIIKGS